MYDPDAKCPRWERFLQEVFDDYGAEKAAMVDFLQRAVGYALTGNTSEHVLFILYGQGANGKSTFLERLQKVFGDYARKASPTLLMTTMDVKPREDIARLEGARLVATVEPSVDQRFAENTIKELTGGDTVSARHLYQGTFEFVPQFTIFLATNTVPIIRGTDDGIWRRLRIIPFTTSFINRSDKTLSEKLDQELTGYSDLGCSRCRALAQKRIG